MTAVTDLGSSVMVASQDDLRRAVRRALARCGMSFAELASQARKGRFETTEARRAWVAIGDLGHLADR